MAIGVNWGEVWDETSWAQVWEAPSANAVDVEATVASLTLVTFQATIDHDVLPTPVASPERDRSTASLVRRLKIRRSS